MHLDIIADYDPDIVIWSTRAFYVFAAYIGIIVRFIPDLRIRFLDYGARLNKNEPAQKIEDSIFPGWFHVQFDPVLDWLADFTVPHSWFAHFYLCSSVCSAAWILYHAKGLEEVSKRPTLAFLTNWHTRSLLGLLLMQTQGFRRLYECLAIAKVSHSRMWIGHYAVGIMFYLVTNVAVWLEPALDHSQGRLSEAQSTVLAVFNAARILLCLLAFVHNSYRQHQVHAYLASLTSYQVPAHPIFQQTRLICPHYSFEVNIYITLAILTAKSTRVFNSTMLFAVFFVVINLGITADGTKQWLLRKFPKQRLEIITRSRMLSSVW